MKNSLGNKPTLGNESVFVQPRHGESGFVVLRMEVTSSRKSDIVFLAQQRGTTIKALVNEIFDHYFTTVKQGEG